MQILPVSGLSLTVGPVERIAVDHYWIRQRSCSTQRIAKIRLSWPKELKYFRSFRFLARSRTSTKDPENLDFHAHLEYDRVELPLFIPFRNSAMWSVREDSEFTKKRNKWPKKYHDELVRMIIHAQAVLVALNAGSKTEQCKSLRGVRSEPQGLLATDQTGLGKSAFVSRMYLYPDVDECCLYFLTTGNKSTQSKDIAWCREWVTNHLADKAKQIQGEGTEGE